MGGAVVTSPAQLAESLFELGGPQFQDFATKVTSKLEPAFCQQAWATLAQHLTSLAATPHVDMDAVLRLLHADDLAHGRVLHVQDMPFSQTQIGMLTSMLIQPRART